MGGRHPDDAALAGRRHGRLDGSRTGRGRPRDRGTACPARRAADTPPSGMRKRTGPRMRLSRSPIQRPMAAFSSRVVRISVTSALWTTRLRPRKRSGTVSRGAEIDHVERAARADIGQVAPDEGAEPVWRGREHAADQQVGDLGRGHVDRAGRAAPNRPALPWIGRPCRSRGTRGSRSRPPSSAATRLHAGRRDAEHGEADRRLAPGLGGVAALRRRSGARDHAGERMRAVGQDRLGDRVEALHVGDRIHHHDVGRADIAADIAGRDGRDHHLGDADRQAPHAGRGRATVPPEPPAEMTPPMSRWRPIQASKASAMAADGLAAVDRRTPRPAPRGWALATSCGVTSALDGLPEVDRSTVRVARRGRAGRRG